MLSLRSESIALLAFCIALRLTSVVGDGHNPQSAPKAGEVIIVGQPYTIKWSPGTSGPVSIDLLDNDGSGSGSIVSSTPNTGNYTWTPQPVLATYHGGTDYFLKICAISSSDCTYTYAGRFSLVQSSSVSSIISSVTATAGSVAAPSSAATILSSSPAESSSQKSQISSSRSSTLTTATTGSSASQTLASSSSATSTKSSSGTLPVSTSASTVPQSSSTSSTASANTPGGLSETAKIAIGVIASVLGTALLLAGGFFIYQNRQQSKVSRYVHDGKPELDAAEKERQYYELPKNEVSELSSLSSRPVHELDAERSRGTLMTRK